MKNAVLAALACGLLSACVAQSIKYPENTGTNPARECQVMPITRHMLVDAYPSMLDNTVEPGWLFPAYAGLGTISWLVATPFFPVADLLTAPLRAGQACTWEKAYNWAAGGSPPPSQPAPPPSPSPAKPPAKSNQ
jgi:hypothetical protein